MEKPNESNRHVMPPVYFLVTMLIVAALHWLFPITTFIESPHNYAGLLLIGIGLVFAVAPARALEANSTTVRPFEESDALLTDGLYRFSRNPMYLGMLMILLGIATSLGSLSSLLPIPLFMLVIQKRFILKEEAMLAERFGDRYRVYCDGVRRWI